MPLISKIQTLPLPDDLAARLSHLQPSFSPKPPAPVADLYIGWFNDKPICALWAIGEHDQRSLTQMAVHQANRGRGVLAQFVQNVQSLERSAGRRVLSADNYQAIDQAEVSS
ncbi:MAG: hypothetical protein U0998_04590 [Moraxellaceae bacterium]|nr:hypothetical protein [Moraxellaceae bacterium]MDZ4298109.1 hypothetical protein [Moraxellaceae bacterium]MDZ4386486.1 hypothetical protein [Moraxellaceae bacterium]